MVGALFYLFPIVGQMVGVPVWVFQLSVSIQRVQIVSVPVRALLLSVSNPAGANGRRSSVGVPVVCINPTGANGRCSSG